MTRFNPKSCKRQLGQDHRESGLMARPLLVYPPRRLRQWAERDVSESIKRVYTALSAEESASLSKKTAEWRKRSAEYAEAEKARMQSLVELENAGYEACVAAQDVQRSRLDLLRAEERFVKSAARQYSHLC